MFNVGPKSSKKQSDICFSRLRFGICLMVSEHLNLSVTEPGTSPRTPANVVATSPHMFYWVFRSGPRRYCTVTWNLAEPFMLSLNLGRHQIKLKVYKQPGIPLKFNAEERSTTSRVYQKPWNSGERRSPPSFSKDRFYGYLRWYVWVSLTV